MAGHRIEEALLRHNDTKTRFPRHVTRFGKKLESSHAIIIFVYGRLFRRYFTKTYGINLKWRPRSADIVEYMGRQLVFLPHPQDVEAYSRVNTCERVIEALVQLMVRAPGFFADPSCIQRLLHAVAGKNCCTTRLGRPRRMTKMKALELRCIVYPALRPTELLALHNRSETAEGFRQALAAKLYERRDKQQHELFEKPLDTESKYDGTHLARRSFMLYRTPYQPRIARCQDAPDLDSCMEKRRRSLTTKWPPYASDSANDFKDHSDFESHAFRYVSTDIFCACGRRWESHKENCPIAPYVHDPDDSYQLPTQLPYEFSELEDIADEQSSRIWARITTFNAEAEKENEDGKGTQDRVVELEGESASRKRTAGEGMVTDIEGETSQKRARHTEMQGEINHLE